MKEYNIIFILLDGFRRDKIGLSPQLKNFSQKSIFFSKVITSAPYTAAAMHSIFSGTYPGVNGVNGYNNMLRFKKDKFKILTEYLKEAGYYCAGDVIREGMVPDQGFDYFNAHDEYNQDMFELHKNLLSMCIKKEKFFAYLHYSHIHTDLVINVAKKYNDFSEEYFKNLKINEKNYDKSIRKCNKYLENILNYIKQNNLMDNSIIIIASDHGGSLGERKGEKMYGSFVYDYTIKAFSMIMIPGEEGREIKFQVRHIDLMPTILDILCIKEDNNYVKFQGKSLLGVIKGEEKEDRIAFSETGGLGGPWPSRNKHNVFCIRAKWYKIIFNTKPKTWELYDLKEDHLEQNNIIKKNIPIKMKMINLLLDQMEENKNFPR